MIRRAKKEDIDAMVEFAVQFLADSSWSPLNYDKTKTAAFLHALIEGKGFAVVAERDGMLIGGMVGDIVHPWFSSDLIGVEHILYVHPDHRIGRLPYQLIRAWMEWCKDNGAKQIRPVISTGNVAGERLYQALGFRPVGGAFLLDT